jgi:HPt (histidine-containing phosphotransfer) domain-containing protein
MAFPKILLLVESPEICALAVKSLTYLDGPEVLCASSLGEGLRLAQEDRPDVILLDAQLPGLDLPQFEKQLADQQFKPPPVVILLTDKPVEQSFIRKPLDAASLPGQVREIYEDARMKSQLANLRQLGGDEFIVEMLDLFLALAPEKIAEARAALGLGDLDGVRRALHSLKSSAASLGAEAVRELAGRIEALANEQQRDTLPRLLDQLEAAFTEAMARLEQRRP